jgi:hypothetical protein
MAGLAKPDRYSLLKSDSLFVRNALYQTAHFLGFGCRVEWNLRMAGSTAFLLMTLFLQGGVLFLKLGGVEEHDREEVGAGRCRHDLVPESLADEFREKAGMVEMNMGEKDGIERSRGDRKGGPVPLEIGSLLVQAAIDKQPEAGRLDEIAGAGNLLAGAEEMNFQTLGLPDRPLKGGPV